MANVDSENLAQKEINESMVLSLYIEAEGLDWDDESNFTDGMVRRAKRWAKDLAV